MVLVSKTTSDKNGKPIPTHSFVTGSAWVSLAIEATRRNIVAHAMAGFDRKRAHETLQLSEEYAVECMIALGKPSLEIAEETVSQRRPIEEIAIELK
jgi:nitroreductase